MSGVMQRTLAMLELLARNSEGLSVAAVASALDLPASATHRLLAELVALGYVRQLRSQGDYALTLKLPGLGLGFLARTGIDDIAQPLLEDLAFQCGELVRLSVVDGQDLVWVGVAQGATSGLRYDPASDQGAVANLAYSASGRAFLAGLDDETAMAIAVRQGFSQPEGGSVDARITLSGLMLELADTRARGYAVAVDSFLAGMAAIAVAIADTSGRPIGCLSIAGPVTRLSTERMLQCLPALKETAGQIGEASPASAFFRKAGPQ